LKEANFYIGKMTDKVVNGNRRFCRSICDAYDLMVATMALPVEDPDKCVELIQYVENASNEECYKLKVVFKIEKIV
jgi:hypothetical protein